MIVVLLGYMASGKSTIGKALAAQLKYEFIDLDAYIENKEDKTVSEIFKSKGEIYFRKQEHVYLKKIIEEKTSIVLALGGGTPCYAGNMDVLLNATNVKSFYLQYGVNELVKRLKAEKETRPLVAELNDEDLQEFVAKHLFERNHYYNQANNVIYSNTKNIDIIIEEINSLL